MANLKEKFEEWFNVNKELKSNYVSDLDCSKINNKNKLLTNLWNEFSDKKDDIKSIFQLDSSDYLDHHENFLKYIEDNTNKSSFENCRAILNTYKKFLEQIKLEQIKKDQREDTDYSNDVDNSDARQEDYKEYEDAHKKPLNLKDGKKSNGYQRKPTISKSAIIKAKYKYELDKNHTTFQSNTTNEPYMEAHHLIPFYNIEEMYNRFNKVNIDCLQNIISLCPNCHRAIHNSTIEHKKEILTKLYDDRKEQLKEIGIDLTLDEILTMYNWKPTTPKKARLTKRRAFSSSPFPISPQNNFIFQNLCTKFIFSKYLKFIALLFLLNKRNLQKQTPKRGINVKNINK